MGIDLKKILHSIVLRIPQKIALRDGLRISTFSTSDNALFWSVFTSREYNSLIPYLIKKDVAVDCVVDCGAACGYFSLFIEHLNRVSILGWNPKYVCIEPADFNFRKLEENFLQNNLNKKSDLYKGLVGKKGGLEYFYESRKQPWSSSLIDRNNIRSVRKRREYIDISAYTNGSNVLLKLDVEGAEFDFLRCYDGSLNGVSAMIIEWHHEFGDIGEAKKILERNGLLLFASSDMCHNRTVELYLRE